MYLRKLFALTAAAGSVLGLAATNATAASARSTSASAAVSGSVVARTGAGWLARELSAGDGFLQPFGTPDVTDTAYAVLGLHAAGVGRVQAQQAVTFLKAHLGADLRNDDGTDNPGSLGYVIMAAVASGADPYHFGGRAAVNNLPARLLATVRTKGADAGLFGSSDPTYDGAFREGTALAALAAAHVSSARVAAPLAWLTRQQCANGLWTSYRASTAKACPAADPTTFAGPDTNSTGMAVQGLAAYGQHPRRSALVASLNALRTSDGGFGYLAAPGQSSDPDSTALTIQALLAVKARVGTAYRALAGFQLGCTDPVDNRGAFFFPGDRTPSVLATIQSVPAAAGRTLPIGPSSLSPTLPAVSCSTVGSGSPASAAAARPATADRAGTAARPATADRAGTAARPATADRAGTAARPATADRAGTAGACKGTSGVTVTVDFKAFGGVEQTRCATGAQTTGVTALQHAGFTVAGTKQYGLAFICRINSLPSTAAQSCNSTPPPTAYWSYYHASATAKTWAYATTGANSYKPPLGTIDAWAFGNSAKPSKTPAQVRASKS